MTGQETMPSAGGEGNAASPAVHSWERMGGPYDILCRKTRPSLSVRQGEPLALHPIRRKLFVQLDLQLERLIGLNEPEDCEGSGVARLKLSKPLG